MKAITMIPEKQFLNKLKGEADRLASVDQELFASELSSILDDITRPEMVKVIDAYAADEEKRDTNGVRNLEQQLFEKLIAQQDQIESYCRERNLPIPKGFVPPELEMTEFRAHEQGVLISSDKIGTLISAQTWTLDYLMRVEAKRNKKQRASFIAHYKACIAIVSEHGRILGLKKGISEEELYSIYHDVRSFINLNQIIYGRRALYPTLVEQVQKNCKCNRSHDESCFQFEILGILGELEWLHDNLKTTHHRSFVEQFAIVDDRGFILGVKIAPLITGYYNEKQRLDRIKQNTFWYSWSQLQWFQEVFQNYENSRKSALDNKDYLYEYDLCSSFKKIDGIASGSQKYYMNELKTWLRKLVRGISLIDFTSYQTSDHTAKEAAPFLAGYDPVNQNLLIGEHKINFPKKKGRPNRILPYICTEQMQNVDSSESIEWPASTVYTKILHENMPSGSKKKQRIHRGLYESYEHINERIEKQSNGEIKQFLIFDMDTMRINPTYLSQPVKK